MSKQLIKHLKKISAVSLALFALLYYSTLRAQNSPAAATTWVSTPERVHLLELYTSQGCSSCPPAERWVNTLTQHPDLFSKFVPLTLHVDYWDSLGWKDPFSQKQFTLRQRAYARSWGRGTVYTPGAVLDGREWTEWGSNTLLGTKTERVGVLRATQAGTSFNVEFAPEKLFQNKDYRVMGALLGNGLTTTIAKGENRGKVIPHDFVVFDLQEAALARAGNKYTATLSFSGAVDKAATSTAVAFWVTNAKDLKIVQAVGGKIGTLIMDKKEKLKELTELQFEVTQNGKTEAPFKNAYWDNHADGIYVDIVSGEALFSSLDKFDSGTGWPSFSKPIEAASIVEHSDSLIPGMPRTELKSKGANSHLGHVFNDGPTKEGTRYCINSASLKFVPLAEMNTPQYAKYLPLFKGKAPAKP